MPSSMPSWSASATGWIPAARALVAFWQAWNRESGVAEAWPAFAAALPALRAHAVRWVGQLQEAGELASKLVQFCELKLEC